MREALLRERREIGEAAALRRRLVFAKARPPGAFELIGSFDPGLPEAALFMDPIYRGLMNLLAFKALGGYGEGEAGI